MRQYLEQLADTIQTMLADLTIKEGNEGVECVYDRVI